MIRFDHVTFGYALQRPILRDFSLTVPEGGRVCLTGPSGEGKTTALRLLLGLEKPRRGTVSVPEVLRRVSGGSAAAVENGAGKRRPVQR